LLGSQREKGLAVRLDPTQLTRPQPRDDALLFGGSPRSAVDSGYAIILRTWGYEENSTGTRFWWEKQVEWQKPRLAC